MLRRRTLLQGLGALSASSVPPRIEPYFPDAAHQFIWRNWDLVPESRIAEALGAAPEAVRRIAAALSLGPQQIAPAYQSRLRFKLLRRNWDFVPIDQIAALSGMSRSDIDALLQHDAFYSGHLGPKPDGPPVRLSPGTSAARLAHFRAPAAGRREPRFAFIEELNRPMEPSPWKDAKGREVFDPRIVFPYFAAYGDVLAEDDFESYYPDGILENIARMGFNAIWLHALLRDLAPSRIFPEFGAGREVKIRRLNWLIGRASRHGLKLYLYLNEPRGMPEPFFAKHPDVRGAPGHRDAGLHSLCTSTRKVQDYLLESCEGLFRQTSGLAGALLITASENTTNCYSLTRKPACPRCARRSGPEVIAEVVRLIDEGARRGRRDAHIIAWDWSWGVVEDDPQTGIIAGLPRTVTLMVDFERGTKITRAGVETVADEYSLSIPGPSPRAAAHLAQARARGMRTMAKIQIGNTWELSLLPYLPVHPLLIRKFQALKSRGVSGAMESWTLGGYPSPNALVASAFYRDPAPDEETILRTIAARIYGRQAASEVAQAWRIFAEAFSRYPYSNSLVYSSVVQYGPAHMLYFPETGRQARILNSFDSLGWTKPYGPEKTARMFEQMAGQWRTGVARLAAVAPDTREARRDLDISRAVALYFESIANQVRFHDWRNRWKSEPGLLPAMKKAVVREIAIAGEFLAICEADSRVGFEASLQYFYLPLDIREKIAACRYMLEKQFPEAEKA